MKFLKILKIGGLILLATGEVMAIYFLWNLFTPIPIGEELPSHFMSPISTLWMWIAVAIFLMLIGSIILSIDRLRQLMVLSSCFSLIVAVAWLRSYQAPYHCYLIDQDVFSDHRFSRSYFMHIGGGGICFSYQEIERWIKLSEEKNKEFTTTGLRIDAYRDRANLKQSYYPDSGELNPWKGGWLDKLGVKLWANDIGKMGVPRMYIHLRGITIPCWLILVFFQAFPAIWVIRFYRRWHMKQRGFCLKCSYDLRGNTSEKCPECGTPVPPRKDAVAIDTAKPAA